MEGDEKRGFTSRGRKEGGIEEEDEARRRRKKGEREGSKGSVSE